MREKLKELISDPAWNRHLQNEKGRKKEEREIREKREQEARYIGMILSLPKESVMRIVKTVLSHYAEEEKETTKS